MLTLTKSLQRRILENGFSESQQIRYPSGRFDPLQYLIKPSLDTPPLTPLQLNKRFRIVEMISYLGFRIGLVTLLLVFALDISGLLGDWQSGGLSYQIITAIEILAMAAILLSALFNTAPFWLMEPPNSGYIDKLVSRNPLLTRYRAQVRKLGRSETLMELALYQQHDEEMAQQRQQGESKLKRERRKKREKKLG